jgi:DNA ligase-1
MEYSELVKIYGGLESTSKRLEKIEILANFLKKVSKKELKEIVYLAEGRLFPEWDKRKIGFSGRSMIKALSSSSGESSEKIETLFRKKGDLGLVAEVIFTKKKQMTLASKNLSTSKVLENIRKLAELEGKGTVSKKISFVSELLVNSNGEEAKYIVKTILENLRIGVSSGIIRDSIAKAFKVEVNEVEEAGDLSGDYGEVAVLAKDKKLKSISLSVGKPVRSMLALLAEDADESFKALGEVCQFENKIDGFRLQCHGTKGKINLFTRRMEDVTKQFPDIVEFLKNVKAESYILDCEAVGYDPKTGKYLPFQAVSQRIKRKYDIEDMAKKFPMELHVFDVLYYNGKNLMGENLKERREVLEKIIKDKKRELKLSEKLVTKDKKKASDFFKKVLSQGFEGVMVKNLESKYRPGRYVGGWMKLKNILEPLDLVILGAEYGEGKRAGWLTSYVVACKSGDKFLEVGRVSTGIRELESEEKITYKEMTKLLEPLIISTEGKEVKVKEKIIIEVAYEEIQKSPKYSSGFGLRFPRVKMLRKDKPLNEVSELELVKKIFKIQRK